MNVWTYLIADYLFGWMDIWDVLIGGIWSFGFIMIFCWMFQFHKMAMDFYKWKAEQRMWINEQRDKLRKAGFNV